MARCVGERWPVVRWSVKGRYRVLYSVDDDEHVVLVVKVGHRRDVYRQP